MQKSTRKLALTGLCTGAANGLFGGGGGMILVPLLVRWCGLPRQKAFATSVAVILPLCILSCLIYWLRGGLDFAAALPYLVGGLAGGWISGHLLHRISGSWLRRVFALLILYGGVRALL